MCKLIKIKIPSVNNIEIINKNVNNIVIVKKKKKLVNIVFIM